MNFTGIVEAFAPLEEHKGLGRRWSQTRTNPFASDIQKMLKFFGELPPEPNVEGIQISLLFCSLFFSPLFCVCVDLCFFSSVDESLVAEQLRTAKAICDKYIRPGGISEVAISAQMRDNIFVRMDTSNITENMFDPAQKACLQHIQMEILPSYIHGKG